MHLFVDSGKAMLTAIAGDDGVLTYTLDEKARNALSGVGLIPLATSEVAVPAADFLLASRVWGV